MCFGACTKPIRKRLGEPEQVSGSQSAFVYTRGYARPEAVLS